MTNRRRHRNKNKTNDKDAPPRIRKSVDAMIAESRVLSEKLRLLDLFHRIETGRLDPIGDAADLDSEFDMAQQLRYIHRLLTLVLTHPLAGIFREGWDEVLKNPIPELDGVGSSRRANETKKSEANDDEAAPTSKPDITSPTSKPYVTSPSSEPHIAPPTSEPHIASPNSEPQISASVAAFLAKRPAVREASKERQRLLDLIYRLERDEYDPIADAADIDSEYNIVEQIYHVHTLLTLIDSRSCIHLQES